ncbi:MAG: hypothetical protein IJL06_03715, partial [Kiritimatiellae bacterium]|nr:hypothetical protein [Kiritimatiellia bacterium]
KPLPPDDPTLRSLQPQLRFAARVRALRGRPSAEQVAEGHRLLASASAEDRALGGALLFLNRALEGAAFDSVAGDKDLLVPLAVLDWVRDFGADGEISAFADALSKRKIPDEDLVAFLQGSASRPGGGRSALDLLLSRHDEETVEEAVLPVATAPGTAYDVREQALFKLFEPETKGSGLEALAALAAGLPEGDDSLLARSLAKWTELVHLSDPDDEDVPYKVWDTPLRELSHLAGSDAGLAVRDMANYLEYGLRRDHPDFEPVVEEGSWEVAKAFLDRALAMRGSLVPEEADALDRLAASLDRIKAYDPAFAPDDDDDDDPYADEEIDVKVLNAEDAYVAEYLTDDAEGEDPDDEEAPPGVSDDEANAPNDDGALEDEEEPDVDRGLAPLTADEPAW